MRSVSRLLSAPATVLTALNLDSLCESKCPVIALDQQIRLAPDLLVVRPLGVPVESIITDDDVLALRMTRSVVLFKDQRDSFVRPDTATAMLYRVERRSRLGEDRMFGVTFWPPGQTFRVLFVALDSTARGWAVKRTGVYMEP